MTRLSAPGGPFEKRESSEFPVLPAREPPVLPPQHAVVWHEVVLSFLARTVLGEPCPA